MNQTRRATIAVAGMLALAAASAPLIAQPTAGGGRRTSRLDYLTGYLSLTDAQAAQAKTIFDAESTAAEAARGQMDTAQTALTDAVKAAKSDAELDRLAAAVGASSGSAAAIHAKATVKFAAILTTAQKDKFFAMRDRQGGGPLGRARGR